jgi:dTDP-4-amino-4,6-dideoxygalactose transaminase
MEAVVSDRAPHRGRRPVSGASRKGRPSSAFGDVAATSVYPGKNLGAYGDGGAVMTEDPTMAGRVRRLRNHGALSLWPLFVVRVQERDRMVAELNRVGIAAGVQYPTPIHRLSAFADRALDPGSFPKAERLADEIVSLPIYPRITRDQQDGVIDQLLAALARGGAGALHS